MKIFCLIVLESVLELLTMFLEDGKIHSSSDISASVSHSITHSTLTGVIFSLHYCISMAFPVAVANLEPQT